jgi:hypothetical protein
MMMQGRMRSAGDNSIDEGCSSGESTPEARSARPEGYQRKVKGLTKLRALDVTRKQVHAAAFPANNKSGLL